MMKPPDINSMEPAGWESGRDRAFLAALAVYFLASVLLRITISGTADMDETEHLVLTQAWRFGYGSQPPLYAWIQRLSFSVFGVNILALSFLKYTLLFSTYVCVWRIARKALQDGMGAILATLSLFLVPQVAWESYRTLTNTVLATLLAALTLMSVLRLREKPVAANYLLLGAVAGLGMLSKYNYAIFLGSVIVAGMWTPAFRNCLWSVRSLLSVAVALVITAPPYVWIVSNLDRATASSEKLRALDQGTYTGSVLAGMISLAAAWIGYFWPALLVYGFLFFILKPARETHPEEATHQLIKRTLIVSLIACSLLVLLFKVTYFKERWMQPLLFILPVFFMHYLGARLDRKRSQHLLAVLVIPALLAMASFSGGVLLASETGRETRLSPPYEALAQAIGNAGFGGGTIITDDHRIGGNFRLHFRDSGVIVPGIMEVPVDRQGKILLVWSADRTEAPPEGLIIYTEKLLGTDLDLRDARFTEKPMLYWEARTTRLGYLIIAAP